MAAIVPALHFLGRTFAASDTGAALATGVVAFFGASKAIENHPGSNLQLGGPLGHLKSLDRSNHDAVPLNTDQPKIRSGQLSVASNVPGHRVSSYFNGLRTQPDTQLPGMPILDALHLNLTPGGFMDGSAKRHQLSALGGFSILGGKAMTPIHTGHDGRLPNRQAISIPPREHTGPDWSSFFHFASDQGGGWLERLFRRAKATSQAEQAVERVISTQDFPVPENSEGLTPLEININRDGGGFFAHSSEASITAHIKTESGKTTLVIPTIHNEEGSVSKATGEFAALALQQLKNYPSATEVRFSNILDETAREAFEEGTPLGHTQFGKTAEHMLGQLGFQPLNMRFEKNQYGGTDVVATVWRADSQTAPQRYYLSRINETTQKPE